MPRLSCFVLFFVLAAAGCAGSSAVGDESYHVIDVSEVEGVSTYNNALELVTTLRPLWFEDSRPVVYMNGDPLAGGLRQLSMYQPEEIARYRFYSSFEQKPDFVTAPTRAALVVTTR